ncbi:MAG TPA: response regulator [Pyrinomonadaceae bacterium]|nr:response regulator [Pyrinomonadaceae bacterium]
MQKLNILIADDDLLARMVLERLVVTWGHTVISAADGETARELLKTQRVDVCIIDWEMPRLSGLALCKWIRSTGGNRATHVIITTSKGRPEDIQEGYEAGANNYLTKPTDLKYLRRQLTRLAENVGMVEATERSKEKLGTMEYFGRDLLFSQT